MFRQKSILERFRANVPKHPVRRRQQHLHIFFLWTVLVYLKASFKEIRESFVMGYAKDMVDDDEFLLFYDFYG